MQQAELKLDRSLCGQLENCAQRRSAKLLLLCGTCSEVDNAQREELKGGEREERGGTDRLETAKRVKRGGIGGIVEDLKVDERVLIPRPETEQLCDIVTRMALSAGRIGSVLDLCTGSGCIAWTLAGAFPGAEVTGADISPEALAIASSQDIDLPHGCRPPKFVRCDVLSGADGIDGEFDIIVSNPPYVRESEKSMMRKNVLEHEPGLALFVPDDDPLVFYRAISAFAVKRLRAGGIGAVEINEAFGGPVADIFSSSGFGEIGIIEDFRAKIRFVTFKK